MKQLSLFIMAVIFSAFMISCGDDDGSPAPSTTPAPAVGEPPAPAVGEPPAKPDSRATAGNSTQQATVTVNGKTFVPPTAVTSTKGRQQVGKLTQSTRSTAPGGKVGEETEAAWLVDVVKVDGQEIEFIGDADLGLDLAFYFLEDGTYDVYEYPTGEWDWGYWYLSDDEKSFVFDPGTEDEILFDVLSLNSSSANFGIQLEDGGETFTFDIEFNAYFEGEGEITTDLDVATLEAYAEGVFWELDAIGEYDVDGNLTYDIDFPEDATILFENDEFYLTTHDGSDVVLSSPETYPFIQFGAASFDVDEFELTLTDQYGEDVTLYLIYFDENELVLAIDDADGYEEYVFTPIDEAHFTETLETVGSWEEVGQYDFTNLDDPLIPSEEYDVYTFGTGNSLVIDEYDNSGNNVSTTNQTYAILNDGGAVGIQYDGVTDLVFFYNDYALVVVDEQGDLFCYYPEP